jgi:hypothetical protein
MGRLKLNKGKTMNVVLTVGKIKVALTRFSPGLGLAIAISLLTTACATEPATQAASASTATNAKVAQGDKQVCRSEKVTGTNFPKRICFTAEAWAEIDKKQHGDAYDYTDKVFEGGAVSNAKNCGAAGANGAGCL